MQEKVPIVTMSMAAWDPMESIGMAFEKYEKRLSLTKTTNAISESTGKVLSYLVGKKFTKTEEDELLISDECQFQSGKECSSALDDVAMKKKKFLISLSQSEDLSTIDARNLGLRDTDMSYFCRCLARHRRLKSLHLEDNSFTLCGAKALADALKLLEIGLHSFSVDGNPLGSEAVLHLVRHVAAWDLEIESLSLNNTKMEIDPRNNFFNEMISVLIYSGTLRELYMNHNSLGGIGATSIASLLRHTRSLKVLHLSHTGLGDAGVELLSTALQQNSSLEELYLVGNNITARGVKQFAKALLRNASLVKIDLDNNEIGDRGARLLAQALKINATITDLSVRDNKIGEEGAQELLHVLPMSSLTAISIITGNEFGRDMKYRFTAIIRRHYRRAEGTIAFIRREHRRRQWKEAVAVFHNTGQSPDPLDQPWLQTSRLHVREDILATGKPSVRPLSSPSSSTAAATGTAGNKPGVSRESLITSTVFGTTSGEQPSQTQNVMVKERLTLKNCFSARHLSKIFVIPFLRGHSSSHRVLASSSHPHPPLDSNYQLLPRQPEEEDQPVVPDRQQPSRRRPKPSKHKVTQISPRAAPDFA